METLRVADPASLPAGTVVGSWRVVSQHGAGSYGVIYCVERVGHEDAGLLALKLALHPLDPRFEREGELLSRLRHPGVPRLEGRGWLMLRGGVPFPYLVMEWGQGVPLYDWADGHTRSSRQVLRVLAQVARALEATHGVGGVHRDVKGANVLVRPEDTRALLLDFGAGDFLGARTLTREVLPPGTPPYRSPEALRYQWRCWRQPGAHYEPGPADDVYALGVTAYRLVTGTYPPPGLELELVGEELLASRPSPVPPEAVVSMCPELARLIRKMLAEEPSARGSAAEVAQALEYAAEAAGPEADQLITRRPPQSSVVREDASPPARARWPWLAVAAGLAVSLVFPPRWHPREQPVEGHGEAVARQEDAGTSGLGEDALMASTHGEGPEVSWEVLGLELPKKPLPGQARPPCKKREVALNGGCWGRPEDSKPPCGERDYEWRGACYYPVLAPAPPATSEPP